MLAVKPLFTREDEFYEAEVQYFGFSSHELPGAVPKQDVPALISRAPHPKRAAVVRIQLGLKFRCFGDSFGPSRQTWQWPNRSHPPIVLFHRSSCVRARATRFGCGCKGPSLSQSSDRNRELGVMDRFLRITKPMVYS
jgi:hypothetical protein